jgi:hypothetical protein
MRKRTIIFLILGALVASFCIVACHHKKSKKKEIDVVKDITPRHIWDPHTMGLLDSIKHVPDKDKLAYINKHLPNLTPTICRQIEERFGKLVIDSIIYSFGSGKAKGAEDSSGHRFDGVYKDQLVAKIWTKPKTKVGNPIIVLVVCLNGVIEIAGDNRIGPASSEFVIQKNEGICPHVDFATSVWLAEKFNLPLYRGKIHRGGKRITPNQARRINTQHNQVSVLVYTGDRFILFGPDARYIPAR